MTEYVYTVFGQSGTAAVVADNASYTMANQFTVSQQCQLTGIWFYSPQSAGTLPTACGIFAAAVPSAGHGQLLVQNPTPAWSGTSGSGWIKCAFDGQFTLYPGISYKACVLSNGGTTFYGATANYWTSGPGGSAITTGPLVMPNNAGGDGGQSTFITPSTGGTLSYPHTASSGENLWVDVEVTTGVPAPAAPVPGFALVSPRNWSPGDLVTTPRLRGDMYNLAALYAQGRPILSAQVAALQNGILQNTVTPLNNVNTFLDTWDLPFTQAVGTPSNGAVAEYHAIPLPGWYLIQGQVSLFPFQNIGAGASNTDYEWGVTWQQGSPGTVMRTALGQATGPSVGTLPSQASIGQAGPELLLLNQASGDLIGLYGNLTNLNQCLANGIWGYEWVGLPSSGTINGDVYTGPVGTVVTTPKPASLWPPGPGGTLAANVSAGGSVLSLGPVAGLRAGQVLGLDWQDSQQSQPSAETAIVASVAGGTVTTTTGLLYGHSAGAPVAVPVSAAFLNEQMRDQSNFLFYPPMLRAVQGTASVQAISSGTWTTVNLGLTGALRTNVIDNFSGFAANTYTVPVSGVYLVAGQVYFAGSSSATSWGAGLLAAGTLYWGDYYRSAAAGAQAPAVRYLLRLTAGQTIQLQCNQNSGSSVNTAPSISGSGLSFAENLPRLIVVWRSF